MKLLACLILLGNGRAFAETLSGVWDTPLGALSLQQRSDRVVGTPRARMACSDPSSANLLEADLLEDSLSGRLFVCLSSCDKGPSWVPILLLVSPDGATLSGTSTLPRGCKAPLGPNGSLVLTRQTSPPPLAKEARSTSPEAPVPAVNGDAGSRAGLADSRAPLGKVDRPPRRAPPTVRAPEATASRERALALARDADAFQKEGKFEQARHRFADSIAADPLYAEGYNGVGVTFFARNDLTEALRWYKKALTVNPSFGDAYYNMACVYALQGRKALALRYLRTAFHNGYTSRETMRDDPDLVSLQRDPAFVSLLGEDR